MRRHSGLGRRGALTDGAGDPLEGLVNLFDLGIVLAVAFLIAGLSLALRARSASPSAHSGASSARARATQPLPAPSGAPAASGRGRPVGTVYRLSDGQLVYVRRP